MDQDEVAGFDATLMEPSGQPTSLRIQLGIGEHLLFAAEWRPDQTGLIRLPLNPLLKQPGHIQTGHRLFTGSTNLFLQWHLCSHLYRGRNQAHGRVISHQLACIYTISKWDRIPTEKREKDICK